MNLRLSWTVETEQPQLIQSDDPFCPEQEHPELCIFHSLSLIVPCNIAGTGALTLISMTENQPNIYSCIPKNIFTLTSL